MELRILRQTMKSYFRIIALAVVLIQQASVLGAKSSKRRNILEVPTYCSSQNGNGGESGEPKRHELKINSSTVHWGYFYDGLQPTLAVHSGDEIFIEMATHHAGDDYDKMIKGDPGMEDIFSWDTETGPRIFTRGATGRGDGVHVVTGPIWICDSEPGDVLQVDILELSPRPNPEGKTYGSNAAAWWGFHQRIGFKTGRPSREVITIYEIQKDESGKATYAVPDYQFTWLTDTYRGPKLSCVPTTGGVPRPTAGREFVWQNPQHQYEGAPPFSGVPCEAGMQQWSGIFFPGLITTHPTGTEDDSIQGKFRIPVHFHPGILGVAPKWPTPVNAVPPLLTGGNLDQRRIEEGTTMYYPIQVEGALFFAGDGHAAQGDSELDGTGIETSINGLFRVTVHKKDSMPTKLQNLGFPLLETPDSYVIHGFTYRDYLNELQDLSTTIFGLSNVDRALNVAVGNSRDFVMQAFNLTEDQAITAISSGCDFGITQVVDGNWGVHAICKKTIFEF
eukprot:TRINITY_DN1490_c2_g1_i2.p1 TRINITY_DN1490_c2_g1~~TRINITY_DN1490_c2_g1_i2.p1  ORF type:complete len:505 (+),score=55.33 TRINITY_DN1490_c2_g1_i2:117-1631(+)